MRFIRHILLKLLVKAGSTIHNVRTPLICVNIRGEEPLAVEVRSQGATAKRQIAPSAAIIVTPPVDIGEGLVVEGEAAEEDLGALSPVIITTDIIPLGIIVVRRICFSLKLGEEGRGGVADGGEDGGVGGHIELICKFVDMSTQARMAGGRSRLLEFTFLKKFIERIAQIPKVPGPICPNRLVYSVEETLHLFGVLGNTKAHILFIFKRIDQSVEILKGIVKFVLIIFQTLINILHLLLNPIRQILKPLRHLTRAHAVPKLPNDFRNFLIMTRQLLNHTKPLEEADDKVQHGVADLILCDVRGPNAAAGKFTTLVIPDELPKSVGQFGNETIRMRTQSFLNIIHLLTKPSSRVFNRLKKFLDFAGEVIGTTTTPILPSHPQDPVYGLLQVGRAV
ncbi:elongation factor Ts [Babesia caballi]|uniref:Elongation factor Ts n=1 Tax=Babesia caballi TaxID=5871 RepID=A0AAV4LMD6_BABCB|nr:elongation factor Ts [Babesia caballi]